MGPCSIAMEKDPIKIYRNWNKPSTTSSPNIVISDVGQLCVTKKEKIYTTFNGCTDTNAAVKYENINGNKYMLKVQGTNKCIVIDTNNENNQTLRLGSCSGDAAKWIVTPQPEQLQPLPPQPAQLQPLPSQNSSTEQAA
jgi:hypothetical protein